jgi:predicted Zn-dependent protease
MRKLAIPTGLLLLLVASLAAVEKKNIAAPVSAQSILYVVADSERELTRMPSQFTRIPDADERRYGDALADEILRGSNPSEDDKKIAAYIAATGAQLSRFVHRRIPMQVHYLPEHDLVNAFALPGGHVFIGAGLVDHLTTEDQLAAVIGHELEHVDHYHCAERLQVEAALRRIPLGAVLQLPISVFQAGYSKDQELEADREGVLLAARAGYSAQGAVQLFDLFAHLYPEGVPNARTPQGEAAAVVADALTGYFRSHPLTSERLAQVHTMIAREPRLTARAQRPIAITPARPHA